MQKNRTGIAIFLKYGDTEPTSTADTEPSLLPTRRVSPLISCLLTYYARRIRSGKRSATVRCPSVRPSAPFFDVNEVVPRRASERFGPSGRHACLCIVRASLISDIAQNLASTMSRL